MTGRTSFIVAAEAGASNPAYPTSIIAPSSPEVQYPEPAKQSPTWRYHSDVLPPPLPKEILSSRPNNGIQPSRHMLAGPTVSTRSSTSSGSRQESIHNGRQTTLPIDSAPDTRSLSHQERYVGFTSTFLHDPEKASPVRYPPSDRPHTSDAFSTYISEEEKDTKEHTVWILVSPPPPVA